MEECWTGHKNIHFPLKGGICFMTIQMKWLHSVSEWTITGERTHLVKIKLQKLYHFTTMDEYIFLIQQPRLYVINYRVMFSYY